MRVAVTQFATTLNVQQKVMVILIAPHKRLEMLSRDKLHIMA